jgi:cytochrome b6-f complex iron-sulfur subunit
MSRSDQPVAESRRRFVNWLLGTSAGAFAISVLYPAVHFVVPPAAAESAASSVTLPFGPADIAPNQGMAFRFGNRPGLLVRTPAGELRAFSAVCTHLSCTVQYRDDESRIWCACHNGFFDLNGKNVQGPPPRPLETYDVNVRGDQIVVSLKA